MNRKGFRQIPGGNGGGGDTRKMKQELEKHVKTGDFIKHLQAFKNGLDSTGRVVNDASVRIDAIQKALVDMGIVPESVIKFNQQNLKTMQKFVIEVLGDQEKPFLERVRAAVEFNKQMPDFRVLDSYWPVRNWLVSNPDEIDGEEMGTIAESFGFSEKEAVKILADSATLRFALAQQEVKETV